MMKKFVSILLCLAMIGLNCFMPYNDCMAEEEEYSESAVEAEGIENKKTEDFQDVSLDDSGFIRYVEDNIYRNLIQEIDSEKYYVDNVSAVYISKEYIDELEYNSKANIFFGYTLEEVDEQFQGNRYVFTLGDEGDTEVHEFQPYDNTFEKVIHNVAVGSGVILICVTVSVVSGGAGAPAVSMIFAASAKSAGVFAVSSGALSGVAAGIVSGVQNKNFDEAIKSAALAGSEAFKWGAITGAVAGGAGKAVALHGATANGLTMNEAALIQKETGYPLDVIKGFKTMDQYEICKKAGLVTKMVDNKAALVRNIDINFVDEMGRTNLQRMQAGLAPLDPTGTAYELHHIGQKADSTLAILTKAEHMQKGNNLIWHELGKATETHGAGNTWNSQRVSFWKDFAKMLIEGGSL